MPDEGEAELTGNLWRPSDMLVAAEDRAVKIAKFLHAMRPELERRSERASVSDAISLAELVVTLSRHGRKQTASQALEVEVMVQDLLDRLTIEVESLLG